MGVDSLPCLVLLTKVRARARGVLPTLGLRVQRERESSPPLVSLAQGEGFGGWMGAPPGRGRSRGSFLKGKGKGKGKKKGSSRGSPAKGLDGPSSPDGMKSLQGQDESDAESDDDKKGKRRSSRRVTMKDRAKRSETPVKPGTADSASPEYL